MRKHLLAFLLLSGSLFAQPVIHPGAMQDLPNTFTQTNQFSLGVILGPVNFANLPASALDGSFIYCPDCVAAPVCSQGVSQANGGADGALAIMVNSAWNCSPISSSIASTLTLQGLTVNGTTTQNQLIDGATVTNKQRFTDTNCTGAFDNYQNAAGTGTVYAVDCEGAVYTKGPVIVDSTLPRLSLPRTNDSGGTTYKLFAKIVAGKLVTATTSDTAIYVWPVDTTIKFKGTTFCAAGTTGKACYVKSGGATVTADAGGLTDGHFVGESTTSNGKAKDLGATPPAGHICIVGIAIGNTSANTDGSIEVQPSCY